MILLLTVLSSLAVLIFAGALIYFLLRIVYTLESIGGSPNSYLARIGYGVRAIERETSHLAPQVTQLNEGLKILGTKLGVVNQHLKSVAEALSAGKEV